MKKKNTPKIAMFCYEDGTFSKELIENKVLTGIVGYVGKYVRRVLCLSLKAAFLPWSSDTFDLHQAKHEIAGELLNFSFSVTQKEKRDALFCCSKVYVFEIGRLLQEAQKQGKKAEALNYCFNFCENGLKKGDAFMANIDWLEIVLKRSEVLNRAFEKIGLPKLSGCYWAATEANWRDAYFYDVEKQKADYAEKTVLKSVLPMFWVEY